MLKTCFIVAVLSVGTIMWGGDALYGQDFPTKSIRIVASEPGGGGDFAARLIAQGLSGIFSQPVIVDNRGGANGVIAAQTVTGATPDGYTLLLYGSGLWLLPFLQKNVPYDPVRDFSPVTLVARAPLILVVSSSVPVKSVRELIAMAKSKPGELYYGTGGAGSIPHLAAELFKSMAGVNIARINYKGTGPMLNALLSGELQLLFVNVAGALPHVKSGRLTALAVTSAQPSVLLANMPTVATAGLPGYSAEQLIGLFAPAKTPATPIGRLNRETLRVLNRPEVKAQFLSTGVEATGTSADEFAVAMKTDMATWGKVISDARIRDE